jgi:hypothetical protein
MEEIGISLSKEATIKGVSKHINLLKFLTQKIIFVYSFKKKKQSINKGRRSGQW